MTDPRLSQIRPEGTAGQYPKVNSTADGWVYDVPASTTYYVARDKLTAAAANTTLTLGATPVAHSEEIWKNGTHLWVTDDYTISGDTVTFGTALSVGDVIRDRYLTTNASASAAALSGGSTPVSYVNSGGATNGSVTVPTGAAAGDVVLYVARGAAAITPPTGWTQVASGNGAGSNSYAWGWKSLVSGDLTGPWVFTNASSVSVSIYRNVSGSPSFATGTVHASLDASSATLPAVGPVTNAGFVVRLIGTASNFTGSITWDANSTSRTAHAGDGFHWTAISDESVAASGTAASTTATFATSGAEDYAYTSVTLQQA